VTLPLSYSRSGGDLYSIAIPPIATLGSIAVMTDLPLLNGIIFAALGVVAFVIAFSLVVKLSPLNLWKEIGQEHNVAAAILAGAVALGLCWIIAATMH
jgi:putative membrane protein